MTGSILVPLDGSSFGEHALPWAVAIARRTMPNLRGGKLLYMMERRDIEASSADRIAAQLTLAFDEHCAAAASR